MRKVLIVFLLITLLMFFGCSLGGQLPEGDFHLATESSGSYEGTVYIKGYASIEEELEPFCSENCTTYNYVMFTVLESGDTPGFNQFIGNNNGNSFVDSEDVSIGLGCLYGENIVYSNESDSFSILNAPLGSILTKKIISSSSENPISLKLTKKVLTYGSGAPACYSHFSVIEEF